MERVRQLLTVSWCLLAAGISGVVIAGILLPAANSETHTTVSLLIWSFVVLTLVFSLLSIWRRNMLWTLGIVLAIGMSAMLAVSVFDGDQILRTIIGWSLLVVPTFLLASWNGNRTEIASKAF